MKIIVPIKQVPESNNVKMDAATGTMVREGVEAIINPLDLYAIEEAVSLRETCGGEVTAISMGPKKAAEALREAVAMGCDNGILLSDKAFAGADTWATSYVLAGALKKNGALEADIIICGERAIDGDTGQVGPGIAAWLDIPFATYVRKIRSVTKNSLIVERMVESGTEVIEIELPCLLTVVKEINFPRLPTLRGKKKAKVIDIPVLTAADIAANPEFIGLKGSPTRVVRISSPKVLRGGEIIRPENDSQMQAAISKVAGFILSNNS